MCECGRWSHTLSTCTSSGKTASIFLLLTSPSEGYMRLSSSEFSTDEAQLDNLFIHLTNNAIQKFSDNYGQFENGNMWTFDKLFDFLEETKAGGVAYASMTAKDYKKAIVQKMKDIILLTFSSVKKKLN